MPSANSVVVSAIGYPRAIGEVWGTYGDGGKRMHQCKSRILI